MSLLQRTGLGLCVVVISLASGAFSATAAAATPIDAQSLFYSYALNEQTPPLRYMTSRYTGAFVIDLGVERADASAPYQLSSGWTWNAPHSAAFRTTLNLSNGELSSESYFFPGQFERVTYAPPRTGGPLPPYVRTLELLRERASSVELGTANGADVVSPAAPEAAVITRYLRSVATELVARGAGVRVRYAQDRSSTNNQITPHLQLENVGSVTLDLRDFVLEYYFYEPGIAASSLAADVWWTSSGTATARVEPTTPRSTAATRSADKRLIIGFASGALAPGQRVDIAYSVHSVDWQHQFDQRDDFSNVGGVTELIAVRHRATGAAIHGKTP
jgi:hypothetical protein